MAQTMSRRLFAAGLAGVPAAVAGSRWFAAAAADDYKATPTVPADQGLQMLLEGNKRFVAGNLTSLSNLAQDREAVATARARSPWSSPAPTHECHPSSYSTRPSASSSWFAPPGR